MKKNFRIVLALVLALSMVLGMVPAMAAPGGDNPPAANAEPTKGTITINSPIMGAKYYAYKVFDLVMDKASAPTAYAYTIKEDSPFYKAVKSYETAHPTEIKLTETIPATNPKTYNISDADNLDAQTFGQYLRDRMADAYEGTDKITNADVSEPTYTDTVNKIVTPDDATSITFNDLAFGYYLITNQYDDRQNAVEVKLGNLDAYKFTINDLKSTTTNGVKKIDVPYELTADAAVKVHTYVTTVQYADENAAKTYVEGHAAQFAKTWAEMDSTEKNEVLTDLQESAEKSAIGQIIDKLGEALSDDNAKEITERWVFVDTTNPNAVVNEKNEIHKWDIPVNPEASSDLPDVPDHDEPKGGKNIIVGYKDAPTNTQPIYAHTTEANMGGDVHYELSVNAVNFERGDDGKIHQIKEYIIADFQNQNMTWDKSQGLMVKIVLKDKDGNVDQILREFDYTKWADPTATGGKDYFFSNKNHEEVTNGHVFDAGNGGIVIPWVEKLSGEPAATDKNVTKNVVFKKGTEIDDTTGLDADSWFEEGDKKYLKVPVYREATAEEIAAGLYVEESGKNYATDNNGQKIQATDVITHKGIWETETAYFKSLYPNDATILVDYHMILNDTAVVDGDGNKNIAQYGVNYVEPNDLTYTPDTPDNPPDTPKQPDHKKEEQDAIVYTYALAIQKVDQYGNHLAGAKFKMMGVTTESKGTKGWYKVTAYDRTNTATWGTEMEVDDDGLLVVEGLPQKWAIEVQETVAPTGYNLLTETVSVKPVKTGSATTASSKETWTDVDGNVTEITTNSTEYKDKDGNLIAKMTKVGSVVKYFNSVGNEITKEAFDQLIANKFNTVDKTDITTTGTISTLEVENNRGAELPSTGGMGTTIFYMAGSLMVLAAAILLITKRRMGAED